MRLNDQHQRQESEIDVTFVKRPDQGKMKDAIFVKDPDGYWIEVIQADLMVGKSDS